MWAYVVEYINRVSSPQKLLESSIISLGDQCNTTILIQVSSLKKVAICFGHGISSAKHAQSSRSCFFFFLGARKIIL